MVISFGRATFRLDDASVNLAIESALGGNGDAYMASALTGRTFSFNVSCKQVGFQVYNLKKFSCKNFECFFNLWGRGGPNWIKEHRLWQREREKEWTVVSPGKRRESLAMQALKLPKPKSSVRSKDGPRKKLAFSESIAYNACKGYTAPINPVTRVSPTAFNESPIIFGSFGQSSQHQEATASNLLISNEETVSCIDILTPTPITTIQSNGPSMLDGPINQPEPHGLEEVVEDIAYRFWRCGRCLTMKHETLECKSKRIRCRVCFKLGHIGKECQTNKPKQTQVWVIKEQSPGRIDPNPSITKNPADPAVPDSSKKNTQGPRPSPLPNPPLHRALRRLQWRRLR